MMALDIYSLLGTLGWSGLCLVCGIVLGIAIKRKQEHRELPLIHQMTSQYATQLAETAALAKEAWGLTKPALFTSRSLPDRILLGGRLRRRRQCLAAKADGVAEQLDDGISAIPNERPPAFVSSE